MKGISPIIASILLIAFTVSASLMLSGWFSSFITSTTSNVSFSAQSIVSCSAAIIKASNLFLANNSNSTVFAVNEGNFDLQARAYVTSTNGSSCISGIYNVTKYNSTKLDIQGCTAKCSDFQKAMLMTNCPEISNSLTLKSKVYYNELPCTTCDSIGSGLVLNMIFSEGNSTNIIDSSTYGNNGTYSGETFNDGTITGAAWTASGKYENALSFDGNGDYVRINMSSTQITGTNSYTLMTWVKRSGLTGTYTFIIEGQNVSSPSIESNGDSSDYLYYVNNTAHIHTGNLASDTWYHIAAVYDEALQKQELYVNGVSKGTNTIDANDTITTLYIGAHNAGTLSFNGIEDSVRIWNRSLSATEISTEMNSKRPINGSNLIGDWEFEEGSGTAAKDTHNWVAGQVGTALKFDGVDDYVNCGNGASLQVTNVVTLSAWIKTTAFGLGQGLQVMNKRNVNGDTSPNLYITVGAIGGVMAVADGDGYYSGTGSATNVKDGNWHHVAGTFSNGVINVFVDGKLDGTGSWDNRPLSNSNSNWNIGYHGAWNSYFNGSIDEVKIYNRALSENEIKGDYYGMCG